MLRVLLASRPARAGWLGGTTFSTLTHGALIALAVMATKDVRLPPSEHRAATSVEHTIYIDVAKLVDAKTAKAEPKTLRSTRKTSPPKPTLNFTQYAQAISAAIQIPDVAATPDLDAIPDAWHAMPDSLPSTGKSATGMLTQAGVIPQPPVNGIYTEDMVDRSVQERRGNPKPRYPSVLANQGIEGDFLVRFVVDSTGTVPDDKIEFPSTMHRLFAAAVRTALLRSRYLPAQLGGRAVAQQVIQEFRFRIGGR
jgi:protein TonB